MARILICAFGEIGHLNPTLHLASTLRQRGHEVVYATSRKLHCRLEALGFERVHLDSWFGSAAPDNILDWNLFFDQRRAAISALLDQFEPAVILNDVINPDISVIAKQAAKRCIQYHITLPPHLDGVSPPFLSVEATPVSVWQGIRCNFSTFCERIRCRRTLVKPWSPLSEFLRYFHNLLDSNQSVQLNWAVRDFLLPIPIVTDFPQLVFCPQVFDFPRRDLRNIYYVEPSIFDESALPVSLPLDSKQHRVIYCAFGSQAHREPKVVRVIDCLCRVMNDLKDWHCVIAVGAWLAAVQRDISIPPNVFITQFAAQQAILKKTSVAIHHGGLGSVKESIWYGVPMIILPTCCDQPGNAARVRFHGIGRARDLSLIDAKSLRTDILELAKDSSPERKRLSLFQTIFRQLQNAEIGASLVEKILWTTGSQ